MIRVALRRQRAAILVWLTALTLLVASGPVAYQETLGNSSLREVWVDSLNRNAGTRLLFGELPGSGIGQLTQWEIGMMVLVCVGVASLLMTITAGRREEEDGLRELCESAGLSRSSQFAISLGVGCIFSTAIGLSSFLVLAAQSSFIEGITVVGSAAFGISFALAGYACAAIGAIANQLANASATARRLGLGVLLVAYTLRTLADGTALSWLNWLSPFGWKAIIRPFTDDALESALAMAAICAALVAVGWLLFSRRELHASYLRPAGSSEASLTVHSAFTFAWRMARSRLRGWVIGAIGVGALLGSLISAFKGLTSSNEDYADLIARVAGAGSTDQQLARIFTLLLVLLACCAAGSSIVSTREAERAGTLDLELAVGVHRRTILASQCLSAALESLVVLVVGAVTLWVSSAWSLEADPRRDLLLSTLVQWAACLAVIGLTSLAFGASRRGANTAWAVIGWSATACWFGGLLRFPEPLRKATVMGWDVTTKDLSNVAVLLALALGGLLTAWAGTRLIHRRDIVVG